MKTRDDQRIKSPSIVPDRKAALFEGFNVQHDLNLSSMSMFNDIVQRFLSNAVKHHLHQRGGIILTTNLHRNIDLLMTHRGICHLMKHLSQVNLNYGSCP